MFASLLRWLAWGVLAACAATTAFAADDKAVSLQQAREMVAAGSAILIDVREPAEYRSGVAPGARLLPMSQFETRWREVPTDPSVPVLLICRTQNRSQAVLARLRNKGGYAHVRYVQGGMSEWARSGAPLVAPPGASAPVAASAVPASASSAASASRP